MIPFELGITLDKALAQEENLAQRYRSEPDVRSLIDLSKKLEGVVRNAGKHAGGVVISPTKLTDFSPLYCEESGEHPVTQFDKDDVEAVGLVKFDFLGLRTLTIIHWALQAINKTRAKKNQDPLDIYQVSDSDEATFGAILYCHGSVSVESKGMKDLFVLGGFF